MASSKISELIDGTNFEPGDATIIVRGGANFKVDPTINAVNAWVNFNGTGTVAIRASYNVSSITDVLDGLYEVNFTNAMTDANYVALAICEEPGSDNGENVMTYTFLTTSVRVITRDRAGTRTDSPIVCVAVIR